MSETMFFVIANHIPVIAFCTKNAAQRFCSMRPDLSYREFKVPSALAGHEEIKDNLRDFYVLKRTLMGKPVTTEVDGLDELLERRLPIHQAMLERLRTTAQQGDYLGRVDGECQETVCPGRMDAGLTSLK